jgi:hypothetical protein
MPALHQSISEKYNFQKLPEWDIEEDDREN